MSKKRIKKLLKKVAPIALAGFGAAMLGKRRRQAREDKGRKTRGAGGNRDDKERKQTGNAFL